MSRGVSASPTPILTPRKAHVLYNQYHEQYAWADEVGFDGIMSNEHHASYWCMKPAVNLDAAVIAKVYEGQDRHPGRRHRCQ